MTESELAKVRELVGAQRELWISKFEPHERDEFDQYRERHRRAFLAVEAMVAPVQPSITGTLNGTTFTELQHAVDAVEAMVAPGREPTAAELHSAAIKKAFEELGPVNQTVSPGNDAPPSITYLTQEQLAKMDCPYPPEPGYEDETPRAGAPIMTLKPCPNPWCNNALVLEVESKGSGGFRVVCHKCGERSPWFATRDKLFDVWNHRPGEDAAVEAVAKYVEDDRGLNELARTIRERFGGKV